MRILLLASCISAMTGASYIPPYLEGVPLAMAVVSLDPPDFTGSPVYRIDFTLDSSDTPSQSDRPIQHGFIHRSWADFARFDTMLHDRWVFDNLDDAQLPAMDPESAGQLDAYLQALAGHESVMTSTELSDFLGINWSGADLKFLSSLPDFMQVVIPALYRAPEFAPEPPVITCEEDAITAPETPFEIYIYLTAFRSRGHLPEYMDFFTQFITGQPEFGGVEGDMYPPGVTAVDLPVHFNQTYVHFLPGGYLNGHTVRISYLGKSKFNFLHEDLLTEWLTKLHAGKSPRRILDIGTGPGFSAFVLAQLFPDAEIVAVDLAAPYIRMARKWAGLRNATGNIQFYQANAEDLSWLADGSFDFINYAYVLHEMPAENALAVVAEMYRLLSPGGTMNGFEVPYFDDYLTALAYTEFNTWGHDEWDAAGEKGPEPYMHEFEFGAQLTVALERVGFREVEVVEYSYFESIYTATK